MHDDGEFLRETERGAAQFGALKPRPASGLQGTINRNRRPGQTWPWPERIDHALGTRPLISMLTAGPAGFGVRDWHTGIIVHTCTLVSPKGRAWLRWHWDHVHNADRRPELRRLMEAHSRLARVRSNN